MCKLSTLSNIDARWVATLLKQLENPKPHPSVYGLREWLDTHTCISLTRVPHPDPDEWAGNAIPTRTWTYEIEGHKFSRVTHPDWDNYQEDESIFMDGKLVSLEEN